MNRTYELYVSLFLICLLFLWQKYRKNKPPLSSILTQRQRYRLFQKACLDAVSIKEPTIDLSPLLSKVVASTYKEDKLSHCQQMTPQGLALSKNWLFVSMYCGDQQHHSQIAVFDRRTGAHHKDIILPKRPHVGGLAYDSDEAVLWVTITGQREGKIGALSIAAIEGDDSATTGVPIQFHATITLGQIHRASYLTYHHQEWIAGSFTLKKTGVLAYYPVQRTESRLGLRPERESLPRRRVLTPTKVQSIALYQEWLFVARSYGPGASEIWVFPKQAEHLNRKTASFRIKCPPYLEQIVVENDCLYCLFESGAAAYRHKTPWPIEDILVCAIPTLIRKKAGFL